MVSTGLRQESSLGRRACSAVEPALAFVHEGLDRSVGLPMGRARRCTATRYSAPLVRARGSPRVRQGSQGACARGSWPTATSAGDAGVLGFGSGRFGFRVLRGRFTSRNGWKLGRRDESSSGHPAWSSNGLVACGTPRGDVGDRVRSSCGLRAGEWDGSRVGSGHSSRDGRVLPVDVRLRGWVVVRLSSPDSRLAIGSSVGD